MKKIILTVIAVILIEIVVVIISAYSGIPDVSAVKSEGKIMSWFLNTTMDHSISARAENIAAPILDDPALAKKGFNHYDEMCISCHGAPGIKPYEFTQGLNPPPPDLVFSTRDLSPSEMFLIVKNGIKMTGMPGFEPTHSDPDVWTIVAFLKQLQKMSAEEYQSLRKSQFKTEMDGVQKPRHQNEVE
jgi:mono/diheme cytochrome c family protein